MAFRIVFARQALDDAREIFAGLQDDSGESEAGRFLSRMQSKVIQIAGMPGHCPRSRLMKGVRRCVMDTGHVFYYRSRAGSVEVLAFAEDAVEG